jgi:ankyrin repeat protein
MWAAAQQHPEVVKTLLEVGADFHARTVSRRQLVNTAGNADYSGVIEVEQGGYTPLLFAARQGDIESTRLLLGAGADVNDVAPSGTSVLVVAAHSGHTALADFLLDKGADANAAGAGYAALHIAVRRGDIALVKSLLAHGANPNAIVTQGSPGRRVSSDVILAVNTIGATPLWLAANQRRVDIIRLLVASGADPAIDKDGTTPMMAAIGNDEPRSLEAIKALVELGADVNAADLPGNTALHLAALRGFSTIAQLLIEKGARLDAKNRRGQTPLALAMSAPQEGGRRGTNDRTAIVELLRRLSSKE